MPGNIIYYKGFKTPRHPRQFDIRTHTIVFTDNDY